MESIYFVYMICDVLIFIPKLNCYELLLVLFYLASSIILKESFSSLVSEVRFSNWNIVC